MFRQEMSIRSLLVASIGNPAPAYLNTLHSAGHTLLHAIHEVLPGSYPPFTRARTLGNGFVSKGPAFTLWQSPSLMNVSGPPLRQAWRGFLRELESDEQRRNARLVVLHDDLESPLGRVKIKPGTGASAQGHNGLRSVAAERDLAGFVRIGVGIGRCQSREPGEVAKFVLRKMTEKEKDAVEDAAGETIEALWAIAEGEGGDAY